MKTETEVVTLPKALIEALRSQQVWNDQGNCIPLDSNVSEEEALLLSATVRQIRPSQSVEVGLAKGVSANQSAVLRAVEPFSPVPPSVKISGYAPFFNHGDVVLPAVRSLSIQEPPLDAVFAVDDGSADGGSSILAKAGFRVLSQPSNLGRGAARNRAMLEAEGDFVVCCDATNVLPPDFARRLLPWFADPKVAAVFGRIQDSKPRGALGRWRGRHLFKIGHVMAVRHHAPLITSGAIVRRSAVLEVGNFNSSLRHSEDSELGERLLAAGYDIVFDPSVSVYCNVKNTLFQVLERYWRWYAGKDEQVSWGGYWRTVVYSIKGMAWQDLRAGDPLAALISLLCPHYQFWKSWLRKRQIKHESVDRQNSFNGLAS